MLPLQLAQFTGVPGNGNGGPVPPGAENVESLAFYVWLLVVAAIVVSAAVILIRMRRSGRR